MFTGFVCLERSLDAAGRSFTRSLPIAEHLSRLGRAAVVGPEVVVAVVEPEVICRLSAVCN